MSSSSIVSSIIGGPDSDTATALLANAVVGLGATTLLLLISTTAYYFYSYKSSSRGGGSGGNKMKNMNGTTSKHEMVYPELDRTVSCFGFISHTSHTQTPTHTHPPTSPEISRWISYYLLWIPNRYRTNVCQADCIRIGNAWILCTCCRFARCGGQR
jgi:hypothetical protein